MMSGVPLETCWAVNERWNNKLCYKVASCWLFLLSHTTMHGSMNIKKKHCVTSNKCINTILIILFPWRDSPQWVRAFSLSRLHDHTQTHHIRFHSSGRVISSSRDLLLDNTQHPQETNIHVPGRIRTHTHSKQAAANPRLTPCGTGIVEFNT